MKRDILEVAQEVLGKPYKSGAMGPKEFDCWGLVRYIQNEVFDRNIEMIDPPSDNVLELIKFIRNHPEHKNWVKSDKPVHGGVVEMSNSTHPHHIGVYLDIDGGGILHCSVAGVTFDPLIILKCGGWRSFIFYDFIEKDKLNDF